MLFVCLKYCQRLDIFGKTCVRCSLAVHILFSIFPWPVPVASVWDLYAQASGFDVHLNSSTTIPIKLYSIVLSRKFKVWNKKKEEMERKALLLLTFLLCIEQVRTQPFVKTNGVSSACLYVAWIRDNCSERHWIDSMRDYGNSRFDHGPIIKLVRLIRGLKLGQIYEIYNAWTVNAKNYRFYWLLIFQTKW